MAKWAWRYIYELQCGRMVRFKPRGNSMTPIIESGQRVTVRPISPAPYEDIDRGDVVLCAVNGKQYLHLVTDVDREKGSYQISNNHGHINGWIGRDAIYGKLCEIDGVWLKKENKDENKTESQ